MLEVCKLSLQAFQLAARRRCAQARALLLGAGVLLRDRERPVAAPGVLDRRFELRDLLPEPDHVGVLVGEPARLRLVQDESNLLEALLGRLVVSEQGVVRPPTSTCWR